MKNIFITLLLLATTTLSTMSQTAGQFELRRYNSGGGMTSFWITPENSKAFGLNGSGVPAMIAVGGSSTLAGLSDVAISGQADLDLLQYNAGTGKYSNIPGSTYQPSAAILTTLSGLSNAAGVLTNNGSGTLSYIATAATGAGIADGNKLLRLDAFGGVFLGGALTLKGDGTSTGTQFVYDADNIQFWAIRRNPASTASGVILYPEIAGTLIGSNDVETVTNSMLAGSIDLASKVTGDLPVANLNGGTGASASTFWRGDGTWGAAGLTDGDYGSVTVGGSGTTITIDSGAVTNAMLAGSISPSKVTGTAAILGANTFTGTQTLVAMDYSGDIMATGSGRIQTRAFLQVLDASGSANRVMIGESYGGVRIAGTYGVGFTTGDATLSPDFTISRIASGVLGLSSAAFELEEMTAPSGAANKARIYAEDNGSGKTRLMVQFATGAAQQIAIEP